MKIFPGKRYRFVFRCGTPECHPGQMAHNGWTGTVFKEELDEIPQTTIEWPDLELMKDPNGKQVKPIYVEPRVLVSPFKLNLE